MRSGISPAFSSDEDVCSSNGGGGGERAGKVGNEAADTGASTIDVKKGVALATRFGGWTVGATGEAAWTRSSASDHTVCLDQMSGDASGGGGTGSPVEFTVSSSVFHVSTCGVVRSAQRDVAVVSAIVSLALSVPSSSADSVRCARSSPHSPPCRVQPRFLLSNRNYSTTRVAPPLHSSLNASVATS